MIGHIGELRRRAVLETPGGSPDGAGGLEEIWSAVATLWAAIEPLTGDERFAGDRMSGHVSHRITIRHRNGVEPKMRFRLGSRLFEIRAVIDRDERRRFLDCLVVERDQ
jgi:SPP1 family predicted phage head-tail adaptor